MRTLFDAVVWHDLECGRYKADLPHWRRLAAAHDGPVLDVGAGTGRVAIDLARRGHDVTALDRDAELLGELAARAELTDTRVSTVQADARDFHLDETFALIVVPMQTIQLLDGAGRARFLSAAASHLRPRGQLVLAITERFDLYDGRGRDAGQLPEADVGEAGGTVYISQPTAVRHVRSGFILDRRRERLAPDGSRHVEFNRERLYELPGAQLERAGGEAGLRPAPRREIPATRDHVGSVLVVLDA